MTDCTERQSAAPGDGLAGEGQEGMPKGGSVMTATGTSTSLVAAGADLVGGRYRLLEVIGAGGMGRVWLAEDELLCRRVAVKEIAGPATGPADTSPRTMREARAAARLHHPGVVKIFDVVWRPEHSWIVMEYVKSRSLHERIREDGPLAHREAARLGLQMLSALRAAHAAGVLHHDVKPHNVLLAEDGRVVLTDFGLATTGDPDGGTEPLMGSPSYVAPERLLPGEAGPAADLWSLGATLFAATEGQPPFARDDTAESLRAVVHDEPDPPRHPGPLTPVLRDLLTKDPAGRPTAADLELRLRRITDGPPIPAPRTSGPAVFARGLANVPPIAPDPVPDLDLDPAPYRPDRPPRTFQYAVASAAIAVLSAIILVIVVGIGRASSAAPVIAPPTTSTTAAETDATR